MAQMEKLLDLLQAEAVQDELDKRIKMGCTGSDLNIDPVQAWDAVKRMETYKGVRAAIRDESSKRVRKLIQKGKIDLGIMGECIKELGYTPIGTWMWITVNPKPLITITELLYQMNKWTKRKFCIGHIYAFEQGGATKDDIGHHIHCHLLMKLDTTKQCNARFAHDIKSQFGSICDLGGAKERHILNYSECNPKDVIKRIDYCSGDKKLTGDKAEKSAMDILWRDRMVLKRTYTSENWSKLIEPIYVQFGDTPSSDEESSDTECEQA